jgi:hypothetical protein
VIMLTGLFGPAFAQNDTVGAFRYVHQVDPMMGTDNSYILTNSVSLTSLASVNEGIGSLIWACLPDGSLRLILLNDLGPLSPESQIRYRLDEGTPSGFTRWLRTDNPSALAASITDSAPWPYLWLEPGLTLHIVAARAIADRTEGFEAHQQAETRARTDARQAQAEHEQSHRQAYQSALEEAYRSNLANGIDDVRARVEAYDLVHEEYYSHGYEADGIRIYREVYGEAFARYYRELYAGSTVEIERLMLQVLAPNQESTYFVFNVTGLDQALSRLGCAEGDWDMLR